MPSGFSNGFSNGFTFPAPAGVLMIGRWPRIRA